MIRHCEPIKLSILISSFKRIEYLRRTLFTIATNEPKCAYEVILADETSDQTPQIIEELHLYDATFPWTLVACSQKKFEEDGGPPKFFNNPSWTNNVAYKNSRGSLIVMQGNEVLPWKNCYNQILEEYDNLKEENNHIMVYTTTYDMPEEIQIASGPQSANLTQNMVNYCSQWPLQSKQLHSMVTNYISLTSKEVWELIGGYDETYLHGIACDDSDFSRRFKSLPGAQYVYSDAVSLHCNHGSKSMYQKPKASIVTEDRWDTGLAINRAHYAKWDGTPKNPQTWPIGTYGVTDLIRNGY